MINLIEHKKLDIYIHDCLGSLLKLFFMLFYSLSPTQFNIFLYKRISKYKKLYTDHKYFILKLS